MFRFTPYLLKGLWRHRARTVLTVSGSAVALFVFCFVGAVQEGLNDLTDSHDNTLIVFQENRFCPTTSRLPEDYARTISTMDGVQDVVPIQVLTNNCRASLDVIVFNGLPPKKLRSVRELELTSGNWSEFEGRIDAALVGAGVARRRNLRAGQPFSLGAITVKVVGVFESPVAAEENLIYTHLEFLQRTGEVDNAGLVTELEVHLADNVDADAVAAAIDEKLRTGPVATATRRKGVFQASALADLVGLISFAHWLGYACLGLVLSLVATTTVMAVQDRIREHAILQTLGLRPGKIFRLVISESGLVCLLGGLLGTGLALAVLAGGGLAVGAEGVTIAFRPSFRLALVGLGVSVSVGLMAGVVPAWRTARTHIVTALDQG